MTAAIATRIAEAWAVAAALQLVLWVVQQRTRNAGIVDVGWATSFAGVVAVFAAGATAPMAAWAPIAAIACAWSLRLGGYLTARGAARSPEDGWLRALGAAIAAGGVVGETIADAQLARWRRDPARRGQVCDTGLWACSRHPNYFSEWCVWLGHAVYGLAFAPWGLVALAPQAILLASILKVTGIPATEAQALRSKGDAYREYQRRVSKFVPCPPQR